MKKLLYIDDDREQLDLYKMSYAINSPKIEFFTESDPAQAMARIKEIKPDIILLDLVMTEISGFDILFAMRKDGNMGDIKVVAFTNSALTNVTAELNKLGVTEIWEKIKGTPKEFALRTNKILGL